MAKSNNTSFFTRVTGALLSRVNKTDSDLASEVTFLMESTHMSVTDGTVIADEMLAAADLAAARAYKEVLEAYAIAAAVESTETTEE